MAESFRKRIPICRAVGEFVNGKMSGDVSLDYFAMLVDRFKKYPRQVPIFNLVGVPNSDHPADLDEMVPTGWVEGLAIDGDWLMADATLHGEGAQLVRSDRVRGASIGTRLQKAYTGEMIGEVLDHLVLTNNPYIKGMNIAATQAQGAGAVVYHFTALTFEEGKMPDPKETKEPDQSAKDRVNPNADEPTVAALKERDDQIVTLKGKLLAAEESVEELKAALESRPVDVEKEEVITRLKKAEYQLEAMTVREAVEKGLTRGTLKPSWCAGFRDGGLAGTMTWFKASRFGGDLKLLNWAVENNPTFYVPGKKFSSGAPVDSGEKALTQDDRETVRKLGVDPEQVLVAMKGGDFSEYKAALAAKEK